MQTDELTLSVNERHVGKTIILEQSDDPANNWEAIAGPLVYPTPEFFDIELKKRKAFFRTKEVPAD